MPDIPVNGPTVPLQPIRRIHLVVQDFFGYRVYERVYPPFPPLSPGLVRRQLVCVPRNLAKKCPASVPGSRSVLP